MSKKSTGQKIITLVVAVAQVLSCRAFAEVSENSPIMDILDANVKFTSLSDSKGKTSMGLTWTKTFNPVKCPPSPLTTVPARGSSVQLKSRNGIDVSRSDILRVTAPPVSYIAGPDALEDLLKKGVVTVAQADCMVHYQGEGSQMHQLGTVFAEGTDLSMATGLVQNSCQAGIGVEKTGKQADFFSIRSVHSETVKIPEDAKKIIEKTVASLRERLKDQDPSTVEKIIKKVGNIFLSGLTGALMWRMRGGGGVPLGSTQAARLLFAGAGFSAIGLANGLLNGRGRTDAAVEGAIAGMLMLPGTYVGYYGNMDFNAKPHEDGDKSSKLLDMSMIGLARVIAPALYLTAEGYKPESLLAGGAAMGACYWSTAAINPGPLANGGYLGSMFDGYSSYAEACTGAALGVGLSATLASKQWKDENPGKSPSLDDVVKIMNRPEFKDRLATKEDQVFDISNWDELDPKQRPAVFADQETPDSCGLEVKPQGDPKSQKFQAYVKSTNEAFDKVEEVCKHSSSDFSVGGSATAELAGLAKTYPVVKNLVCQFKLAPGERKDSLLSSINNDKCWDMDSVIATHNESVCSIVYSGHSKVQ